MMSPMSFLAKVISTVFGLGYLPLAPGTWASLAAAVLAWYLPSGLEYWVLGLTAAGLWACAPARRVLGSEDPNQFVMDEVCGMALAVLWVPKSPAVYAAAFILFRLLDILKPWIIRRVQNWNHPWSIMGDDILAGVLANLLLQAAIRSGLFPAF